jgi:thiamine biosynthesis lipoprotein
MRSPRHGDASSTTDTRGWLGLALLGFTLLTGCGKPDIPVAELTGQTMGTGYSVKLAPAPDAPVRHELQRAIDARLAAINRQMSTYLADSDLSRFNAAPTTEWWPVPAELVELVGRAAGISDLTDGAFDVTVGPLVDLWGFGSKGGRATPPNAREIADLMPLVGYRKLDTRRAPPALRKSVGGLQIDLSSIAKGWAVDQIAGLLTGLGYANFLVEIGGEVYARGEKQPGQAWHIAIEKPLPGRRQVQRVIALNDMALASSGDYRNYYSAGERRYSHTIDPRTGQSVRHRLAAVSVLADNCAEADAWATALMALGERLGPATARREDIKALFLVRRDQGLHEIASDALLATEDWQTAH